ncbi:MAG: hypothetical protein M3N21_06245 [Actinomycetota bacterium]|nr:hypothetical protein [Actinomycetota bacterium]
MADKPAGGSRGPAATNLAVGAAVLVLLVPLLLKAASGAPPTAAEFAPNADQVIKHAPPGQGVDATGTGGQPTPAASPGASKAAVTPTAGPTTLSIPQDRLRACVGPPPLRQIEDPQSPPCVQYWLGKDNGGATWAGVTRDTVYISIPTPDNTDADYLALQNFFNKRFEFYGRKLKFEFCDSNANKADQATQNADAAAAAKGCNGPKPFASTFYRSDNGRYYNQTMACRYHVVTAASYLAYEHTYLNRCAPYLYQYPMEAQQMFTTTGDWMCSRLAGQPAIHGSGVDSQARSINTQRRKFGILVSPTYFDDPVAQQATIAGMRERLRACGSAVDDKDVIINPVDYAAGQTGVTADPASATNAVLRMKQDNVTTIACLCNLFAYGALARAASGQAYHPEWLVSTYGGMDCSFCITLGGPPSDQLADTFGLTFQPRQIRPELDPYNMAVHEGDPSRSQQTEAGLLANREEDYRPLLLLASGIQMAGPNLTPATFRAGLLRTTFPNPITVTHAGAVGFSPSSWGMTTDAAEWWWSNTAIGPYSDSSASPGTLCYVDAGRRRTIGEFPTREHDPFFTGTCDSGR